MSLPADPAPLPAALEHALRSALRDAGGPASGMAGRAATEAPMRLLPDKGLAHLHVQLVGTGLLLRCPKQSQLGLAAAQHLAYEAACFERAEPSGHTPRLHAVLAPRAGLPRGALLVEHVPGRAARLPQDLGALADALAALHALPLPAPAVRPPLRAPADPLAALREEIEAQARFLPEARLHAAARRGIETELRALEALAGPLASALISFDAHPGNFIVRPDGRAILVDLEKARYAPPPLDLAHATLYTSTTWDRDSHAVLTTAELLDFHHRWLTRWPGGAALRGWIAPLRQAMWLWSVTWCAKWRVLSERPAQGGAAGTGRGTGSGEDWSSELSDPALVAHVRERVGHYLSPAIVERVRHEAESLRVALA